MNRAYGNGGNGGDISLIYRLTRTGAPEAGEGVTAPRLPMTLDLVLKAKGDLALDGSGKPITCAQIARRWFAAGDLPQTGAALPRNVPAKELPVVLPGR